jgi:hypothetical protein
MRIAELKSRVGEGGLQEALMRCLIYIGKPRGGVDERSFEMIRDIRRTHEDEALPLADFKKLVREQFFMLLLDEKAAVAAIPSLLPDDADIRAKAFGLLTQVLQSSGPISGEVRERWEAVARLLGLDATTRRRAANDVARAS